MEKCYYTISNPVPAFMIWQPGQSPMLHFNPTDWTGNRMAVEEHFRDFVMIYVPWEAVMAVNS